LKVNKKHLAGQAGWNFVAQLRSWLPGPIGGILWFGVDDASFSVHAPFHGPLVAFVICFLGIWVLKLH
jgi:hypothetical protein